MAGEGVRTSVLIAGGGPVGITLSMSLAKRGVASIVLEAREDIPPNPRCNTTNARSMEIFRLLGCADAIRAAGLPADHSTDVVYMTDLAGAELARFERPTTEEVIAGTAAGIGSNWPTPEPQHFISQLHMEPVLRRHAVESWGVDLRLGWKLVEFTQDADGVTAIAEHVRTGERLVIAADYIVGADGSSSIVRRSIGATLEGLPELENTTSIFFRSVRVDELFARTPGWMYRFPGGAMLVAISEHEWLIHTQVPRGEDPSSFDYEPQMFRSLGEKVEYDVIGISRWTARAMVANKFVQGRAAVVGDAAHIWVPMGGFGMNAGIGDADALGWRLAGILQGWLDPKILLSFESERSSLGNKVASQAPRWRAAIAPIMQQAPATWAELREPANASLRADFGSRIRTANLSEWESVGLQLGFAYENSPIVVSDGEAPPPFSVDEYVESSVPGVRAPHLWRRDPERSLYDDFGDGLTLLRLGDRPPTGHALVALAAERGIPLRVVEVPETESRVSYGEVGLVLVRPDQYIAWRSRREPDDAAAILDTVTGRALVPAAVVEHDAREVSDVMDATAAAVVAVASHPSGGKLYFLDDRGAVFQARVRSDGTVGASYPFVAASPPRAATTHGGAIAVDPDGRVWVVREDSALCFDGAGRLVERVATPTGVSGCTIDPERKILFITGVRDGEAWIAEHRLANTSEHV